MDKRHITRAVALLGAAAALAGCVAPYGPGYRQGYQAYYGGRHYEHHEDRDHAEHRDRYAHHEDRGYGDHGDQGDGFYR